MEPSTLILILIVFFTVVAVAAIGLVLYVFFGFLAGDDS